MVYSHLSKWQIGLFAILLLMILAACETPAHTFFPTASRQEEALEIARQQLPSQGVLEQGPDGFVYLKVTNQYVYRLFPLVQEPGFDIPSSIKRHTKIGAHISVFYKGEAQAIGSINELGKVFTFEPKRIRVVRSGRKEYMILEVKASELERLRQQYGFSPKLMNHEFHITLAERNLHSFRRH